MTLTIGLGFRADVSEDNYTLDVHMLRQPGTQLFIASNKWDSIVIKSLDGVCKEHVRALPIACSNIKLDLDINLDDRLLQILCTLYPGRAGRIRKCFLLKGNIREILDECPA